MTETNQFDQWCILEIMGHQRYAGRVTEQTVGGCSFIRIDIPAVGDQPGFTKLFGASSVYAITPTTEQLATALAQQLRQTPISVYDLPAEMRELLQRPKRIAQSALDFDDDCDDLEDHDGAF